MKSFIRVPWFEAKAPTTVPRQLVFTCRWNMQERLAVGIAKSVPKRVRRRWVLTVLRCFLRILVHLFSERFIPGRNRSQQKGWQKVDTFGACRRVAIPRRGLNPHMDAYISILIYPCIFGNTQTCSGNHFVTGLPSSRGLCPGAADDNIARESVMSVYCDWMAA